MYLITESTSLVVEYTDTSTRNIHIQTYTPHKYSPHHTSTHCNTGEDHGRKVAAVSHIVHDS